MWLKTMGARQDRPAGRESNTSRYAENWPRKITTSPHPRRVVSKGNTDVVHVIDRNLGTVCTITASEHLTRPSTPGGPAWDMRSKIRHHGDTEGDLTSRLADR